MRVRAVDAKDQLNRYEHMLMQLTQYELNGNAHFQNDFSFVLMQGNINGHDLPTGLYELPRHSGDAYYYRLAHPLAQHVIEQAKARSSPPVEMIFEYTSSKNKISVLEELPVKQGWCQLSQLTVESLYQTEDRLVWTAITDDGQILEEDIARRMFMLPAKTEGEVEECPEFLDQHTYVKQGEILSEIGQRNARFFEAEIWKLEAWSDDRKVMLEREISEYDRRIKEARRFALAAVTLQEKLAAQKEVKTLEKERTDKRRALFEAQDEIDAQRDSIIAETEKRMEQTNTLKTLFCVRWRIV